jgi:hypothetical protein
MMNHRIHDYLKILYNTHEIASEMSVMEGVARMV